MLGILSQQQPSQDALQAAAAFVASIAPSMYDSLLSACVNMHHQRTGTCTLSSAIASNLHPQTFRPRIICYPVSGIQATRPSSVSAACGTAVASGCPRPLRLLRPIYCLKRWFSRQNSPVVFVGANPKPPVFLFAGFAISRRRPKRAECSSRRQVIRWSEMRCTECAFIVFFFTRHYLNRCCAINVHFLFCNFHTLLIHFACSAKYLSPVLGADATPVPCHTDHNLQSASRVPLSAS